MAKLFLDNSLVNKFIQVIPITLIIGVLYIIFRISYLKKKKVNINYQKELMYLIFVCYLSCLFNLVLVPVNFWSRIWQFIFYGIIENPFKGMLNFTYNLVPTLYKVMMGEFIMGSWVKIMIIGNILMFLPLGIFLTLCFKRINNKNIFIYALLIPLMIEIIQPIIGRSFDIDDIIMNFLGIIIGYFMIFIMKKIGKRKSAK